ncbi:MAG TPA: glycine--tRNA ligase [Sporichthya sp.]|nr:glycine--tRNA ligase [Sporichthya sp.]
MLTMQDALLALTAYWTERGAMIVQPMNTEVGAGTANPATMLRVLGPEPWKVAYVEPSVRPDDARYGENPNRIQMHTQYQVILKPEPGDPQQLYLGSLEALGVDTKANDIRFVEDNWAQPAIGAWGLGWEVWLNGMEITQFTYFQAVGGQTLDPVCVELTYGMERILMAIQGVGHFKEIAYAPGPNGGTVSYGEAFGQAEYEMSRYYLDDADVATNRALFDLYSAEAKRMVEAKLPVPAQIYVLKCSHAFNVMDARGAVSTTDRAAAFRTMQRLAREVAELWISKRAELGHPLGLPTESTPPPLAETGTVAHDPVPLVFEIGVEEMPPHECGNTVAAVREALTAALAGTGLAHGPITVDATPRRVVATVAEVAAREEDSRKTVKGPKVSAAYDADGNLTKAAQGFARGQGVEESALERVTIDGVEYVGVSTEVVGRSAIEVLAELLPGIVSGLRSEKNMRWNAPGLSFTRPIRWILALLGQAVVPFQVSNMASGRETWVHRNADAPIVAVNSAAEYPLVLAANDIVLDTAARRSQIVTGAQELAASVGATVDTEGESDVVDEVTNLVETPNPLLGSFEERYLELPPDILVTVMRKHQRYLPVRSPNPDGTPGTLRNYFVAVANGECDSGVVRKGNEAVLRARYEDAAFFWRADLQVAPLEFRARLDKLTFADKLGSMDDRAKRIAAVALELGNVVDLSGDEATTLRRAGELAKFDLATDMVVELSKLAGIMAREYAIRAGESPEVATALHEMEMPRSAGAALPASVPGALLALADRLDLLAGLFATGAEPKGSSDPFGLRRAALGALAILRAHPRLAAITIPAGLAIAGAQQPVEVPEGRLDKAAEFTAGRYEQALLDAGHPHKLVQAVLPLAATPTRADATLAALPTLVADGSFAALVEAVLRIRRLVPAGTPAGHDAAHFQDPAEGALADALAKAQAEVGDAPSDLAHFAAVGTGLVAPINAFFEAVLVMAEDPAVQANRLGLLAGVRELSEGLVGWEALA